MPVLRTCRDLCLISEPCSFSRALTGLSVCGVQSIRLPQMVKRSISNKSFLGRRCSSPSPSSPVSVLIILSSSSSGVVRNVSDSLLGMLGGKLSAKLAASTWSDAEPVAPFSVVASRWKTVEISMRNSSQSRQASKKKLLWGFRRLTLKHKKTKTKNCLSRSEQKKSL